ncbi:MAG TPA: hypothetical protein VGZ48_14945 [Candidatus Acidoferrales bacterium]|jgi:hypothetical protein|nr:hypothetical protein [Candidatus Acidoferrales bacterium]
MSIRSKWRKALVLMMMASASFMGAVDPQKIENIMEIMNATQVEFTLRKENDGGDGLPPIPAPGPDEPPP